ncbi:Gfo/Idh/MocA family protein [Poseidonocella sp. HB161398]|uniref:Gfo/Idh/MocA family protein n=1 Tax=Poseidonocella sp. HB161398 TaxID=2320855 RepID=UPI001109960C|nr:Gfo/Idh/MocA family oxidoreductase [Poseidonocella sp. HB161398]
MEPQTGLRWGVLGSSGIARAQVIPAINATPGCRVTALASRDPARGREVAAAHGIGRVFPDYAALVASGEIDALYIPLPNALHEDWALKAAARGIPVLCEKPLSTGAASARRIVEGFRSRGVPLMEAFMYRFHPLHARVRELVAGGAIGALRLVEAHISTDRTGQTHIAQQKSLGGGVLLDAGCYPVNLCRMMFGSEPVSVLASQEIDPVHGTDVTTAAILDFGDGRLGMVSASHRAGGISSYRLVGSSGTIEVPRGFLPGWGDVLDEPLIILTDGCTTARREIRVDAPSQYRLMVQAFAEALRSGTEMPYPPEDAIATLAVTDAIFAAAASGCRAAVG